MSAELSFPTRVQRTRKKGFRLPPNTVSVCRPGRFGNPIRIEDVWEEVQQQGATAGITDLMELQRMAQQMIVDRFAQLIENPNACLGDGFPVSEAIRRRFIWMRNNLSLLKGKNLACFCPLVTKEGVPNPCHVNVLLPLVANTFSD